MAIVSGWPCRDLNLAATDQAGILGERSSAFFDMVKVMCVLQQLNELLQHPSAYWLENVDCHVYLSDTLSSVIVVRAYVCLDVWESSFYYFSLLTNHVVQVYADDACCV